jgi:hypothetical protein
MAEAAFRDERAAKDAHRRRPVKGERGWVEVGQPGSTESPSLEAGGPPGGREGRWEERNPLAGGVKELDRVGMGWVGDQKGGRGLRDSALRQRVRPVVAKGLGAAG